MESISDEEYAEIIRVVELTSDAVALCAADGAIQHVNHQLLALLGQERDAVLGQDIKDILYSERFERACSGALPFTLDGSDNTLMLKLHDGSFIPVSVRAVARDGRAPDPADPAAGRMLVAMNSLEERYAHDRQQRRLLSELESANKRLSGTLSIIMSTLGSSDLSSLLDTILNSTVEALDATGATIYFSENGGFKLRGVSDGLKGLYVPDFIPYGAGIPTHVLREGRPCRITVMPISQSESGQGLFYDLDERRSHKLRLQETPPFKTVIATPVYYGTSMFGVVELGWARPATPREADVHVLEVICDYLSIELVGMVSSLRSERTAELERSLNRVRDILFEHSESYGGIWGELSAEIRRTLRCHVCPVIHDRSRDCYVIDGAGGTRVDLPVSVEEAFFSTTSPATRLGQGRQEDGVHESIFGGGEPRKARLTRVDRSTQAGLWLARHGLPSQGVFVDMGPDVLPWDVEPGEGEDASAITALATREDARPNRMLLLLRDSSQEPIDDLEFDYLTRMICDFENIAGVERKHTTEHRIAQALQSGMRSSLGRVPGITTDSLYLSATSQALVGGDLYTLIRLPDERAIMILGDVSGKGIEAASMSSFVKTALSAYAWEGTDPAQMADALNSMLMSFSSPETFVTAFIAKIDLRAGSFTYCSAGHPPALLARAAPPGETSAVCEVEVMDVQSGVIGAFENMPYENGTARFKPGDILFMYTDGAIEARSPTGEFFGEDRLRLVVGQGAALGVEGLCEHVLDQLDAFTDSSLDDDIALVALRFDKGGRD